MKRVSQIQVLGDSILKGIQVEPATGRYVTRNDIGISGLERDFGLTVKNGSHFGATVIKGQRLLERLLQRETPCDVVVMDFGGNDCDFRWDQVAADPEGDHRQCAPGGVFAAVPGDDCPAAAAGDCAGSDHPAAAGAGAVFQLVVPGTGPGGGAPGGLLQPRISPFSFSFRASSRRSRASFSRYQTEKLPRISSGPVRFRASTWSTQRSRKARSWETKRNPFFRAR